MSYDGPFTKERKLRGLLAEYRFFFVWMNTFVGDPNWFCGASQGSTLMDVRNTDGFVWTKTRHNLFKRIPIQIKTWKSDMVEDVSADRPVYILLNAQMPPDITKRNAVRQVEKALDLNFEPFLYRLLKKPATPKELKKMADIDKSRAEADRQYLIATGANELSHITRLLDPKTSHPK